MPLLKITERPGDISFAIWQIRESDNYFLNLLNLNDIEVSFVNSLKGRRKTEWLASRWVWNLLTQDSDHSVIVKDEFGKPRIKDSDWHMSISHTKGYAAVITAPLLVGIDIQTRVRKIFRIGPKFLHEMEYEQVQLCARPLDHLHVYWGAKECLYKAYGRREISFRKHLRVKSFNLETATTEGVIIKESPIHFKINFEISKEFILVYASQKL